MDIRTTRLHSQQLAKPILKSPREIVSWMGAMQSQDFFMAKLAISTRAVEPISQESVEEAFNSGEILRTHVMRPTWHFVTPDTIRWMLALTAPRIKPLAKSRDRELELDEAVYAKSNSAIQKALEGNKQFTKEEIALELNRSGIVTNAARIYHILIHAELDGLICSGAVRNKKQTWALLDERVPQQAALSKEEALARLAQIYLNSHSPATLQDFSWWSGLNLTESKQAFELIKSNLVSIQLNAQTYWFTSEYQDPKPFEESFHLLPAFDEYVISYKDRSALIPATHHAKAISSNGIFRPTILRNGKIVGIWKKTTKPKKITCHFFEPQDQPHQTVIDKAVETLLNLF